MRNALLLAAVLTIGCASTPQTPEQRERDERIRQRERDEKSAPGWVGVVRNAEEVRGCKSLGLVTGSATDILGNGQEGAIAEMQEKTAKKGGNTLLLGQVQTSRHSEGNGEAYECPERTLTPRPTPTP